MAFQHQIKQRRFFTCTYEIGMNFCCIHALMIGFSGAFAHFRCRSTSISVASNAGNSRPCLGR